MAAKKKTTKKAKPLPVFKTVKELLNAYKTGKLSRAKHKIEAEYGDYRVLIDTSTGRGENREESAHTAFDMDEEEFALQCAQALKLPFAKK